jgi:hypothetical protein
LEQYSTKDLYEKALKRSSAFVQKLFAERPHDTQSLQLTIENTGFKTSYVDWCGQLHENAIHFAVIAKDYEMIDFLLEMGMDINISTFFPALFSRHPTDEPTKWETYCSQLIGTPLTTAVNRYVRSKHVICELGRKSEIMDWRKMIQHLINHGAHWARFANSQQELLGPQPAFRSDASSVLWRTIDYNDRIVYKLIIEAQPPLKFEWLPWKEFFESEEWWISNLPRVMPLSSEEAERVIRVLREHPELTDVSREESLKSAITQVLWRSLPQLQLSQTRVDELFEEIMAQVENWHQTKDEANHQVVLEQLALILKEGPNLEEWVGKHINYRSVLHFSFDQKLYQVLKTFLIDGKANVDLNLPFEDRDTLLDKAISSEDEDMKTLLEQYKAKPAYHQYDSPSVSTAVKSLGRISTTSLGYSTPMSLQTKQSHTSGSHQGSTTRSKAKLARLISKPGTLLNAAIAATQTAAPGFLEDSVVDYDTNYSDSEYHFGEDPTRSPMPFDTPQRTLSPAMPAPSAAMEVLSPSQKQANMNWAGAVRKDLDPSKAHPAPSISYKLRPRLTKSTSHKNNNGSFPKHNETLSSSHGEGRGRGPYGLSRGRGRGRDRGVSKKPWA